MILLGLCIDEACLELNKRNINYNIVHYYGPKPYTDADCWRVVRNRETERNFMEITVCAFKSRPDIIVAE